MKHYSTYQSQFIEMFGNPVTNDKNWETMPMKDIAPEVPSTTKLSGYVWLLNLDMIESHSGQIIEKVYEDDSKMLSVAPFDTGNVLYSKLRPYLNKVVVPDESGYATTELVPLRPNSEKLNRVFLSHLLRGDNFVNYANSIATGTKMPRMPLGDLRKFKCILPPMDMQLHFVDIAEQADKSKFTSLKSQFIEMFGNLDTNIKSYPVTTVEKISLNLFAGGDKPEDTSTERTDKYIYPVWANGEGERGLMGYSKTYRVDKEALTISARGTIGYCAIREPYFTPIVRLITLIPNEKVDIVYLKYFFDQTGFESTGAVQGQLTIPTIKVKKVLVPPIEEQMKFAEVVKQADKSKYIN